MQPERRLPSADRPGLVCVTPATPPRFLPGAESTPPAGESPLAAVAAAAEPLPPPAAAAASRCRRRAVAAAAAAAAVRRPRRPRRAVVAVRRSSARSAPDTTVPEVVGGVQPPFPASERSFFRPVRSSRTTRLTLMSKRRATAGARPRRRRPEAGPRGEHLALRAGEVVEAPARAGHGLAQLAVALGGRVGALRPRRVVVPVVVALRLDAGRRSDFFAADVPGFAGRTARRATRTRTRTRTRNRTGTPAATATAARASRPHHSVRSRHPRRRPAGPPVGAGVAAPRTVGTGTCTVGTGIGTCTVGTGTGTCTVGTGTGNFGVGTGNCANAGAATPTVTTLASITPRSLNSRTLLPPRDAPQTRAPKS